MRQAAPARDAGELAGRLGPSPSRPPARHSALFLFLFLFKNAECLNLCNKSCVDPKIMEIFV